MARRSVDEEASEQPTKRLKKYVFKDEADIKEYISILDAVAGPVHSLMALIRNAFAARTY